MDIPIAPGGVSASASCVGGTPVFPSIDRYPLLACLIVNGEPVLATEDGVATVREAMSRYMESWSDAATAASLGTTEAHVSQAIAYAAEAGWFRRNGG